MWCKSFARTEQMHVDAKEKEVWFQRVILHM